jgi:Cu2+-exporting ATPase/Cu+-exporting ATPase
MERALSTACAFCGTLTDGAKYCCPGCEALDGHFTTHQSQVEAFTYLDQPNFRDLYRQKSATFDYLLYLEGIHCSSCVHLLEDLPRYENSLIASRLDFGRSQLFLKVKDDFSLARMASLLTSLGYRPHFLKPLEPTEEIRKKENKLFLKKFAVAGACAGNIMLFSIPLYAGLNGPWQNIFQWLSFLIFLPIVFYSGTSFYQSAWSSLRFHRLHIDLPITIALWSGFLLSTVNLIRGHGEIYFDSTASFIFLILGARFFLKRTQQRLMAPNPSLSEDHFLRLNTFGAVTISADEIRVNDLLKLTNGQTVPADAVLESVEALIDVSVLNGEPMPRQFAQGMEILAGSKILSSQALLKVKASVQESHLALTLQQLQEGLWRKSKFVTLTDRCAQALIFIVFAIAVGFFVLSFNHDPQAAFDRALALIIIACPCALALGAPLTSVMAMKKAEKKGILVKNNDVFERVLKIKNIFFDKTGTLTEANLHLRSTEPSLLSAELKNALISLEQRSQHPIAFALRNAWPEMIPDAVGEWREESGKGIYGVVGSHIYQLGQISDTASDTLKLCLKRDGQNVAFLNFENALRPEAQKAVQALENKGLTCSILSGDRQSRVNQVAAVCGISLKKAHGGLTAEEKRQIVESSQQSCMIGDGTNDALSLQAASVGIAMKGSTAVNLQAADVCFLSEGLSSLLELLEISQQAKRVLLRNLVFSLLYNFIGGTLALAGFINPLVAAVLMPISSALIILSTLWGLR